VRWPLETLLPGIRAVPAIEAGMPQSIPATDRKGWIDDQRKADEEAALAEIDGIIRLGSTLEVALHDFAMARDLGLIASLHQGGGPPRTPEGWQVLQDPPAPNRKHWSRV
jgi:hypothetical protein